MNRKIADSSSAVTMMLSLLKVGSVYTHHKEHRGGAVIETVSSVRLSEERNIQKSSPVPVFTIKSFTGEKNSGRPSKHLATLARGLLD